MANTITFNLSDAYSVGGLEEVVLYSKFYVSFTDSNGIVYNSNEIVELKGVSDSDGKVVINIDDLVYDREYQRYHESWWNKVYMTSGIIQPETEFIIKCKVYNSSTTNFATKTFEFEVYYGKNGGAYNQKGVVGEVTVEKILNLISIQNDFNFTTIKENYKQAESAYLMAKEEYTNNIKNSTIDTSEIFERVSDYEPTTWVNVITRLLELNEGTIDPALRFTKNGGMSIEYNKLIMIKRNIDSLLSLYPNIAIKDGEGMPYYVDKSGTSGSKGTI